MLDFSARLLELIKERRSVRIFTGEKIPREEIKKIIEAGIWAPTGCNNQELRFLILDGKEVDEIIANFKPFFKGVSTVVLIFCDMSLPLSKMYVKSKTAKHLCFIDAGLALANMILYAKSKGIDSCIFNISEHHLSVKTRRSLWSKIKRILLCKLGMRRLLDESFENYLRKRLKIPNHLKILCGVAFGYAKEYPDVRKETHGGKPIMRKQVDYYIIDYPRTEKYQMRY